MPSSTTLLHNVGALLSGDLTAPRHRADAVLVEDGRIVALLEGPEPSDVDADLRIDVGGATVAPGLIDSHVHPPSASMYESAAAIRSVSDTRSIHRA